MLLYIHRKGHSFPAGGVSQAVLDRIAALENRIEELEGREATMETPGLVRISKSSAVTDSAGLALAASEKNASLEGTLASEIKKLAADTIFKKSRTEYEQQPPNLDDFRKTGVTYYNVEGSGASIYSFSCFGDVLQFAVIEANTSLKARVYSAFTGAWSGWKNIF